jgi:acyl-CoA hydrolase
MVEYLPLSRPDVPRLFENGQLPLDVAMVQVASPDPDGTCSLGISVDVTKAAALAARTVVAEVNAAMPRTAGDSRIPVDRIACFVPVDEPVVEYLHDPAGEVAEQIARYVARLIEDRSTLQVGLGRVPNQMLAHLTNRHDLAIHSDVICEPIVDLVAAGIVTGPVATSWAMGTRRLYDLVDDDPRFSFHPIDHICDPAVIRSRERMVSVTQALSTTSPARSRQRRSMACSTAESPRGQPSTAARSRPRRAWRSSVWLREPLRAVPPSAPSSVPTRRSRFRAPTCTG